MGKLAFSKVTSVVPVMTMSSEIFSLVYLLLRLFLSFCWDIRPVIVTECLVIEYAGHAVQNNVDGNS